MKKNYIGFSRDHSGSMAGLAGAAMKDYNDTVAAVREAAISENQDTLVSVVRFGGGVFTEITNASVTALRPLTTYPFSGQTPLFDSVGRLIEIFEKVPTDLETSFLVSTVTDGEENSSQLYSAHSMSYKIKLLQATDRWTFVFRVPRGYSRTLINLGIPEWNILEWDQTQKGVEVASQATREAFRSFYTARSAGATSTKRFYADLSNVTSNVVAASMKDISADVMIWPVSLKDDGREIKDFVEKRNKVYYKGAAFYQLSKPETIQDHKRIMIRDKTSNAVYEGAAARQMMAFPLYGSIRARPGNLGNFDLFIQSTSVNRKLVKGTNLVYWTDGIR